MKSKFSQSIVEKSNLLGLKLTEDQIDQFYEYYTMMLEWNQVMNLTAIVEMEDVILKHFIDSLSIVKAVENWNGLKVMDVGTGAGFPGIPLNIVFPDLEVTLLDSVNKKLKFLDAVIEKLDLKKISTLHGRAEDFGRDKGYRETYDLCVSRAVANLAALSEYCLPFVKVNGYFVSYKSGMIEEELNESKGAIFKLAGKVEKVHSYSLPESDMERSLIMIRKTQNMSGFYPRKAGSPTKEPLK